MGWDKLTLIEMAGILWIQSGRRGGFESLKTEFGVVVPYVYYDAISKRMSVWISKTLLERGAIRIEALYDDAMRTFTPHPFTHTAVILGENCTRCQDLLFYSCEIMTVTMHTTRQQGKSGHCHTQPCI
jgi:hypothetical protein